MNIIVHLSHKNNREKVYNMVIHVRKLPFGGDFLAINLCGLIFALRDLTPEELNHERIHTARSANCSSCPSSCGTPPSGWCSWCATATAWKPTTASASSARPTATRPSPTIWPAAATIATSPDPAGASPPLRCHRKKFIRPLSCPHKITGG